MFDENLFNKKNLEEIYNAERLYYDKLEELKDCKEFVRMARMNLIEKIKIERTTYDYISWAQAFDELKITDGRKKKPILNFLESKISEDFFDSKVQIKISELCKMGLSEYGVIVYFDLNNRKYYIEIPLKENLCREASDEMITYDYGKFCFAERRGDSCWEIQATAYDIGSIKEFVLKSVVKPSIEEE